MGDRRDAGRHPAVTLHGFIGKGPGYRAPRSLTRVRFQHADGVTEVLRVLDDRNLCHPNDHCVWTHLRGRRGVVAIGDVMEGAGRVVVVADDRGGAWGATEEVEEVEGCRRR